MRDVVNARRLARACAAVVATDRPTRRDVKRLRSYVEVLRGYVDNLQRQAAGADDIDAVGAAAMEIDELAEFSQKLVLFETFVRDHEHVLTRGEARPEAPPLERQASEERERRHRAASAASSDAPSRPEGSRSAAPPLARAASSSSSSSSSAAPELGMPGTRDHDRELEELLGRAPPSSFADFMAGNGAGPHAVEDQLRRMEEEQELLKDDVSQMVGNIRHRLLGINDNLQKDKRTIDMVHDRADRSLDMLETMSQRLNITMASSSYNCKMCALGVVIVLALWVFAYLVMRIFPKVR